VTAAGRTSFGGTGGYDTGGGTARDGRAGGALVIRGATVIAPPAPPLPGATVVVRGGRISQVLAGPADLPGPATVIDGAGQYLIPGLTDMHVHFHRDDRVNRVLAALLLAHGVTTAFCMHGTASVLRLRAAIDAGRVAGPAVLSAGPIQNDSQLTFALGRRRARDQRRRGYDAIKVYNDLARPGFDGLCSAARELGMPVVGHIVRAVGTAGTLASYQSLVAHAEEFVYAHFGFRLRTASSAEAARLDRGELPRLAGAARTAGLTLVATLQNFAAIQGQAADAAAWLGQPEMALLPAAVTRRWKPGRNTYAARFSKPFHQRRLAEAAQFQSELVAAFHQAGVPVLAGTDALVAGSVHGVSLHRELALLAAAGLPAAGVLHAATAAAGDYLGTGAGRIEPGAAADLVLVSGDPSRDITAARSVTGVLARGRWRPARDIWAEHAAALAACSGPQAAA
jgi:cytosine/adenosine deaminase-related metal-dependent hydrolase